MSSKPLEQYVSDPIYVAARNLLHDNYLSNLFVNVWFRWDTGWYLRIAASGYDYLSGTIAFSPLYPFLMAILGKLTGDYLVSALLISSLATLFVYLLLYEVALIEGLQSETALRVVFSLIVFPSAFFFFAAYTDSLFLAFVLGAWLAARRGRWLLAGLLGMLAALTRLQGALLTIVLIWSWLVAHHPGFNPFQPMTWIESLPRLRRKSWLVTLLPAMAFGIWSAYLRFSGLGSVPDALISQWNIKTVLPWQGIWLFFECLFTTERIFVDYIDLLTLVFIVILLIMGIRKIAPPLSAYAWLTLLLFFMRGSPPHLLDSFSRYMLAVFPAFLVLGQIRSRLLRIVLWPLSFGLQMFLLMAFLDWRWVA